MQLNDQQAALSRALQDANVNANTVQDWAAHGGRTVYFRIDSYLSGNSAFRNLMALAKDYGHHLTHTYGTGGDGEEQRWYLALYPD